MISEARVSVVVGGTLGIGAATAKLLAQLRLPPPGSGAGLSCDENAVSR